MPLRLQQAWETATRGSGWLQPQAAAAALALLVLAVCCAGAVAAEDLPSGPTNGRAAFRELLARAEADGAVDIIVGLDLPFEPEGRLGPSARIAQRKQIAASADRLLTEMRGSGARENRRFRFIPFLALTVDAAALRVLQRSPLVRSVSDDQAATPVMESSNPVIGSPAAWAAGWDGAGQAVAVLDTGVETTHPWFANTLVTEACFSRAVDGVRESLCPDGSDTSTVPGSGAPCTGVKDCDHGTHVAGSAVGNNGVGPGFGVARGADLVAIQVFTRVLGASSCGGQPPCLINYASDLIAALEHVLELGASMDIAAVNISLGGGAYSSQAECDGANPGTRAAIDNLLSAGIATVIASGNSGLRSGAAQPGCISTAVTVGATTDADEVASFSNIASFIDLLAPGVDIVSAVPGGGTASKQGTSMAAPHVAGAFAVLREHSPGASADALLLALVATGTLVDDTRGGGTVTGMRRINVDLALAGEVVLRDGFEQ